MEEALLCGVCNMKFCSTELLKKHKARFCIGSERENQSCEILIRHSDGDVQPRDLKPPNAAQAGGRRPGHAGRLAAAAAAAGEMAALHQHRLALIRAHKQQLEQQREELDLQVDVPARQSGVTHLERLLTELREQEERNEETLQQLDEHVHMLHIKESPVPVHQTAPPENKMKHDDICWELVSTVDGPLSAQIKALQGAYMRSGGSDPAIVAQMQDLQQEAQDLEKSTATGKKEKGGPRPPGPGWKLQAVEQENQRLEEEILLMQTARTRRHQAALRAEHAMTQTGNLRQTVSLRAASRPLRQIPLQPRTHIHAPFSPLQARSFSSPLAGSMADPVDCLGPAPYDPVAGFMVFYDLVLGVDASQEALRLVASLYSEGQEAGPPTPLPPVRCLPAASLPCAHSLQPGLCALLSVKQPVPRMQPSPSLSLVVEVQTASHLDVCSGGGLDLMTCGWTRLDLFDRHNQLCSGYWRTPVRRPPIRPSLNSAQLNSIAQVNNMELFVRLVNGRDGGVQSAAKPPPSHYKYPAVMSPLPVTVPVSAPQSSGVEGLSSLLPFTDQISPPPTEASQS